MNKPTFTFGSLFSGIGALDLGFERAGFTVKWQVENNEFCQKVLAKHWPDVARHGDVRHVGKHNLAPVDCLVGGFPCQPHSQAGERKASQDERDLWPEFYRLICELKPRWVVAENVLGLLSSEDGEFFGNILRDLAKAGYDARWQVLSAAQFGAPHLRERVIVVAHYIGQRSGAWRAESAEQCGTTIADCDGSPDVAYATSTERQWSRNTWNGRDGFANDGTTLAYPRSTERERGAQLQTGWDQVSGERDVWADADRRGETLANASSPEWWASAEGWRHVADWTNAGWEEATGGLEFCGEELAYTSEQGLAIGQCLGRDAFAQCSPAERDSDSAGWQGTTQPGMGRAAHGPASWLDGYQWPAGPGQEQYDWEAPRVVTEKVTNRTARLKGLGNAVVVALAEAVGREIMAVEAERQAVA